MDGDIGGGYEITDIGRLPWISSIRSRTACALCQRSAGSRSKHFETSSLMGWGMVASQSDGGAARSCMRFNRLATTLSAW